MFISRHSPSATPSPTPVPRGWSRVTIIRRLLLGGIVLGAIVGCNATIEPLKTIPEASTEPNTSPEMEQAGEIPAATLPEPTEVRLTKAIAGTWKDRFYGERTMTFYPDGTGLMLLKLDTAGAFLYGEKLEFDFAWTLVGNELTLSMRGGRPEKTTRSLSKTWGSEYKYKILETAPDQLIFEGISGSSAKLTLTRLPE